METNILWRESTTLIYMLHLQKNMHLPQTPITLQFRNLCKLTRATTHVSLNLHEHCQILHVRTDRLIIPTQFLSSQRRPIKLFLKWQGSSFSEIQLMPTQVLMDQTIYFTITVQLKKSMLAKSLPKMRLH